MNKRVLIILSFLFCSLALSEAGPLEEELFSWQNIATIKSDGLAEYNLFSIDDSPFIVSTEGNGWILEKSASDDYDVECFNAEDMLPPGASYVQINGGLLCFGVVQEQGLYTSDSWFLKWNQDKKCLTRFESFPGSDALLPTLPLPCLDVSIIEHNSVIYALGGYDVATGKALNYGWSLDLDREKEGAVWIELPQWTGTGLIRPNVVIQSNGTDDCIFICGGYEEFEQTRKLLPNVYRYSLKYTEKDAIAKQWSQLAPLPDNIDKVFGILPMSQSHIMVACDVGSQSWLDYNTITDVWFESRQLSSEVLHLAETRSGLYALGHPESSTEDGLVQVSLLKKNRIGGGFALLDYVALLVYSVALILMGLYFSKKETSTNDFFLAGGRIPAWAAALSIFGTGLSAISFITVPSKTYSGNWVFYIGIILQPVLTIMSVFIFVPLYRRFKIVTVYEYLENRFNYTVRSYGSLVFIFSQLARLGVVLYLPALTLATVTGLNIYLAVLIMGVVCIVYTVMGGIEAVIWTDVAQVIIITLGTVLCFIMIISSCEGGITGILKVGFQYNKFVIGKWSGNWTTNAIWVVVIGHLFWFLGSVGNQSVAQRYLSVSSEKEAKKSAWIAMIVGIPVSTLFFILGTSLFAYYRNYPGELNPSLNNDCILPWFISMKMPAGVAGFIVAAIFAASMSSVDTSMNSGATVFVNDFYQRFNRTASGEKNLLVAKIATLIIGVIGVICALIMAFFSDRLNSILEFIWECDALMAASLGGVFVLGMFFKRANAVGAIFGIIAGMLALYIFKTRTSVSFFLYYAIGMTSCVLVGYTFSVIFSCFSKKKSQ